MNIFNWLDKHEIKYFNKQIINNAFIHSSYVNENPEVKSDYERLEYIGDAILQLWVSEKLYALTPKLSEGDMTTLRSSIVCEEALVSYAKALNLSPYLKLGLGEERSGGRKRDSILADMMEAFLGALYLDSGYATVDKLLKMVINFKTVDEITPYIIDYKTKLQEYIQTDSKRSLTYEVIKTSGPSNNPTFEIVAKIDDIKLGVGVGPSKKKAEQNAAKDAFLKLVK